MSRSKLKPETDKLAGAKAQGQAQFDSIKEMVERLQRAIAGDTVDDADKAPAEYEILLCTGGPACRIIGTLNQYGEPDSARLEVQDWFQPWTEMRPIVGYCGKGKARYATYDSEPILLAYARCFYFGEG